MEKVYDQRDEGTFKGLVIEEKFRLIKKSDNVFVGKYPLEAYMDGAPGAYGGDLVSQAVYAAYQTLEDSKFSLHSTHNYFLKAGSVESPMRYEVETNNVGKSYINKSVKVYYENTNELAFILMCSFTPVNNINTRKLQYQNGETKRVPFEFITSPGQTFYKHKDNVDELVSLEHTHGLISHALLPQIMEPTSQSEYKGPIGDRVLLFFCKILDEAPKSDATKTIDLLYLTDSFYLGLMPTVFGLPLSMESTSFFRVSLDHAVHIYDDDYDPTEWIYFDVKFSRLSNGRVMCQCYLYDLKGKLIATVTQEGLVSFPVKWLDNVVGGSYKL